MKNQVENLEQVSTSWGPIYQAHVAFLKQKYSNYYEALTHVNTGINAISLIGTLFPKGAFQFFRTETKLCLSQEGYYYTCLDCSLMENVGLCKACFDPEKHVNHNWMLTDIKGKPYCDCGFSGRFKPEAMCKSHGKSSSLKDKLTQSEQRLFKSFFIIYMKLALQKLNKKNNNNHLSCILSQLTDYVAKNMHYIRLTTQILVYRNQNEESTLLQQLILAIRNKPNFYKVALKLFVELCNYQKFEYSYIEALFLKAEYRSSAELIKFFFQTSTNLTYINELATKKIFVNNMYKTWDNEYEIIKFYTSLAEKFHAQNNFGTLCSVWKSLLLYNKNVLQLCVSMVCTQRKKRQKINYFFIVLRDATTDQELFADLMDFMISSWKYTQRQGYQSKSQIYNELIKIGLHAVGGRIEDFANLFYKCNKDKLSKFVAFYFSEVLDDNRKCKFNSLTAKCLFQIHKKLSLKTMSEISIATQISPLKLAKTLSVVLRNLTAFQYCENFELLKIAKAVKNYELFQQKQRDVEKWFQQFMYMRQQIPKNLLIALRKQGLFNVGKIKNLIGNQARFNKSTASLQYAGPQLEVNPDLLLYRLDTADQIYGLTRKDTNEMFYKEDRKQFLIYLLTDVVKRTNLLKYASYTKRDRYLICVTAVIAQKITQGFEQIKQYLNYLQTLELSIKSNEPIDRLLKLRVKPVVVDVQSNPIKLPVSEEIKEIKSQNQTIQSVKEINIQQVIQKEEQKLLKFEVQLNNKQVHHQVLRIKEADKLEEKQQKVEVKDKIFLIEKEENKKSPALLKVLQQKEKKKNRLAQKYASKSKKHLNSPILQKQQNQQEVCLVCRQVKNDYGPLYYFASIKKNKNSTLFNLYRQNNKNKEQFMIDSCFHAAHINCLKNSGNKKCVLCSTAYDMFIPVVNSGLDVEFKEFVFMSWWNQDFKTIVGRHTNRKADQEVFMVLFRPFISNLGIKVLTGGKQIKNFVFKNQAFLTFLTEAFRVQTEPNKNKIRSLIEKDISQNMSDKTKVISIIEGVIQAAVLNRLDEGIGNQQMAVWIVNELYKIKDAFLFKYCEQILKNVQWLLSVSLSQFKQCFMDKPTIEQLWQHLQILYHIPQSLLELKQKYYKICGKCGLLCRYLCIMCNIAICDNCIKMRNHISGTGCICVGLDKGQACYSLQNTGLQNKGLYFNFCQENYDPLIDNQNMDDFKLNKAKLYEILYKTLDG